MPLETALTRALGIRIPVVQGGMMWVGTVQLATAVSNAGGLGIITALSQGTPPQLREAIRKANTLTSKPFGVNLTFLPTMGSPPYDEYVDVIIEEKVKVVETAGGPAAIPVIQRLRKAGIFVVHKCTSVRHAKTAERFGVNMLSIDGFECAGFPGEDDIGGIVLLARAARELKLPFLASGGFADGRGLAAALALGAAGANMGTAFMVTDEAEIHQNIKDTLVKSTEHDTIHIYRTLRNTGRVYKNKVAEEVVAIERRPGGCEFKDIAHLVAGSRGKLVYETGDVDAGIWGCGISVGLITKQQSCADFLKELEKDCLEIIGGLVKLTSVAREGEAKL